MYAVIETGGKQLRVEKGAEIYVEKLDANEGDTVIFDRVLMLSGKESVVGQPYIEGANVEAHVIKHGKQRKITVFKFKAKKNYRRKQGHRQPYTKLKIIDIKR